MEFKTEIQIILVSNAKFNFSNIDKLLSIS